MSHDKRERRLLGALKRASNPRARWKLTRRLLALARRRDRYEP
jgi:hypothetical protein